MSEVAALDDLSRHHEMLTTLFARPAVPGEWREYALTNEQVKAYHTDGYLAPVRMLDDNQVEALRAELVGLMDASHRGHALFYEFHSNESTDPAKVLFHALGAWRIGRGFHDLLWNPAFVVPAAQLLNGAVRFWHDQLFCKPPRHGGVVAWHQDYSYWTRTVPMAHLTCWIALDDASKENGCLQYVPGSHQWNLLPITGLAGDMDSMKTVLTTEQRERFTPLAIELRRGEASFHHPLMVHGSLANTSTLPRRGTVINAIRDGVRSASDAPLLEGVPAIPAGQPLSGQFFPLLFDPSSIGL
jgi:ectoine hydroxylase-related dioxygenase (phytanoyl-CoA dioxygenase family)